MVASDPGRVKKSSISEETLKTGWDTPKGHYKKNRSPATLLWDSDPELTYQIQNHIKVVIRD